MRSARPAGEWRTLAIALFAIAGAILVLTGYATRDSRDTLASDRREVAGLQRQLDSTRVALLRDTTVVGSDRLRAEIRQREYLLSRRAYHIPWDEAAVTGWWRPGGGGFTGLLAAAILALIGAGSLRHARRLTATRSAPPGG